MQHMVKIVNLLQLNITSCGTCISVLCQFFCNFPLMSVELSPKCIQEQDINAYLEVPFKHAISKSATLIQRLFCTCGCSNVYISFLCIKWLTAILGSVLQTHPHYRNQSAYETMDWDHNILGGLILLHTERVSLSHLKLHTWSLLVYYSLWHPCMKCFTGQHEKHPFSEELYNLREERLQKHIRRSLLDQAKALSNPTSYSPKGQPFAYGKPPNRTIFRGILSPDSEVEHTHPVQ